MSVAEMFARIARAEVPGFRQGGRLEITPDGGLEYVGPEELLTDDVRRFIRDNRDEILAFLKTPLDRIPKSDLALFDYRRTLTDADLEWIDKEVWGTRSGGAAP